MGGSGCIRTVKSDNDTKAPASTQEKAKGQQSQRRSHDGSYRKVGGNLSSEIQRGQAATQ